jgi:hypothetical protein
MQDDEGGAESVPVWDTGVVGVPMLFTQLSCRVWGSANPCLGGGNDDSCSPSYGSLSCEASSPLSRAA